MRVHITLVGKQSMPVYHGIVASAPDKVIYIYSKESKGRMDFVKNEVNIPSEEMEFDAIDLYDIREKTMHCAEMVKDDVITVNISGGTKPWAFYFSKVFGAMPNATLFYVDQNNRFWNLTDLSSTTFPFNMDALFRVVGNPLKFYNNYCDYTIEDKKAAVQMEGFRQLCYRNYSLQALNSVTAVLNEAFLAQLNDDQQLQGQFLTPQASASWTKGNSVHIEVTTRHNTLTLDLHSPHVEDIAFNSGWFELKVAEILSRWQYAKEIRLNCLFPERGASDAEVHEKLKNEIDIIVATDAKPVFVECKAGNFNSTDINKFHSAVETYGGKGSKAILITGGKLLKGQREKFKDLNILYFALAQHSEKELFDLLSKHLFDSNI